ncbi:MAG: DUF6128 domain-containing protein [Anaerocolumna sp.]
MPDYKRLVSYMYNYEDGMKKNNVGYARVEARNGQCKCTLHIAAPSLSDKQLKVYIFKNRKSGLEGILLGTLQVKNGTGDYKTVTDSAHIMNSSYSLDDMGGIVLYLTERKFFATSWDDTPITMNMVSGIESRKYEKELQAANINTEDKTDAPVKNTEKNAETVIGTEVLKEDLKDAADSNQQVKEKDIKEFEECQDQNEGEVFNDRDSGNELSHNEVLDTVEAEEVSKDKNLKENDEINKEENKEENNKDKDSIKDELNSPVEILENEDLIKIDKDKVTPDNTESTDNILESGNTTDDDFNTLENTVNFSSLQTSEETVNDCNPENREDLDKMDDSVKDNTSETFKDSEYFNNQAITGNDLTNNQQSDVKTEECRRNTEKQPFFEDHPLAKRIYRSFPRMYPFEDNEVAWCVRIEPQDIGLFPMEAWILGNNSFLLHGYYSYRHLIFARMNDKNGINYILGIPGIYHNREKFMAKMFGFENFKCVKRKAQRTGEFGYWYIPITLN